MQILIQDDCFIAINKPAGLLVHRSRIDKHETRFAMQLVRDLIGRHVYPLHRLDKPTSGVLLFALQPDTANRMQEAFESKQVKKTYIAIVRGYIPEQGVIDYPLKEKHDKMTDALADKNKPAQSAITAFQRIACTELDIPVGRYSHSRYSLIKASPRSGRRHQIRRHMKHIFHPIIGDTTHGDGKHNKMFREQFGSQRLLLHAMCLSFTHPYTKQKIKIKAALNGDFTDLLDELGWHDIITSEALCCSDE